MNETISAMNNPKIILDQTDEETLLWEVSDEELEAFSGMGKAAIVTFTTLLIASLAQHESCCFAFP